jgi:hypothetical protein
MDHKKSIELFNLLMEERTNESVFGEDFYLTEDDGSKAKITLPSEAVSESPVASKALKKADRWTKGTASKLVSILDGVVKKAFSAIKGDEPEEKEQQDENIMFVRSMLLESPEVDEVFVNEEMQELYLVTHHGDLTVQLAELEKVDFNSPLLYEEEGYEIGDYILSYKTRDTKENIFEERVVLNEGFVGDAFKAMTFRGDSGTKTQDTIEQGKIQSGIVVSKDGKGQPVKTPAYKSGDNKAGLIMTKDEKTAKLLPQFISVTLKNRMKDKRVLAIMAPVKAVALDKEKYIFSYKPTDDEEVLKKQALASDSINNLKYLDDVRDKALQSEKKSEMTGSEEFETAGFLKKAFMTMKNSVTDLKIGGARKNLFNKIMVIASKSIVMVAASASLGPIGLTILAAVGFMFTGWYTSKYILRNERSAGDIVGTAIRNVAIGKTLRWILGGIWDLFTGGGGADEAIEKAQDAVQSGEGAAELEQGLEKAASGAGDAGGEAASGAGDAGGEAASGAGDAGGEAASDAGTELVGGLEVPKGLTDENVEDIKNMFKLAVDGDPNDGGRGAIDQLGTALGRGIKSAANSNKMNSYPAIMWKAVVAGKVSPEEAAERTLRFAQQHGASFDSENRLSGLTRGIESAKGFFKKEFPDKFKEVFSGGADAGADAASDAGSEAGAEAGSDAGADAAGEVADTISKDNFEGFAKMGGSLAEIIKEKPEVEAEMLKFMSELKSTVTDDPKTMEAAMSKFNSFLASTGLSKSNDTDDILKIFFDDNHKYAKDLTPKKLFWALGKMKTVEVDPESAASAVEDAGFGDITHEAAKDAREQLQDANIAKAEKAVAEFEKAKADAAADASGDSTDAADAAADAAEAFELSPEMANNTKHSLYAFAKTLKQSSGGQGNLQTGLSTFATSARNKLVSELEAEGAHPKAIAGLKDYFTKLENGSMDPKKFAEKMFKNVFSKEKYSGATEALFKDDGPFRKFKMLSSIMSSGDEVKTALENGVANSVKNTSAVGDVRQSIGSLFRNFYSDDEEKEILLKRINKMLGAAQRGNSRAGKKAMTLLYNDVLKGNSDQQQFFLSKILGKNAAMKSSIGKMLSSIEGKPMSEDEEELTESEEFINNLIGKYI